MGGWPPYLPAPSPRYGYGRKLLFLLRYRCAYVVAAYVVAARITGGWWWDGGRWPRPGAGGRWGSRWGSR